MSTQGPAPEAPVPAPAPDGQAPLAETAGALPALGGAGGAGVVAGDPRARLDPAGVITLSRAAGNTSVARMLVQRQPAPAPAPAPAPPAPGGAPAAGALTAQQAVVLSAAILEVSNALNQVFLTQKAGLDTLRRDMERKSEPGLAESIVWALVDAALGAGAKKVAELVATKVGALAVSRLSGPVTAAINQTTRTLTPQTAEPVFTIAIEQAGKAHAAAITSSLGSWASGKVTAGAAATRQKISSDEDAVQQFLMGQEMTLIEHLANRQGELTGTITPVLASAPFPEAMTAAVAMREAAGDARQEADLLQYLVSTAAWGQALAGGGTGRDAALATGARGVLFVHISDDPAAEFRVVSAKLEGMPDAMRKRIRSTPAYQQRPVADWPLPKVIQNRRLYLAVQAGAPVDANSIRLGHEWLAERGKARYGMESGPAIVPAALLAGELAAKTIKDLGELGG